MGEKKLNILDYTDVDEIYCLGDIHGNFNSIKGFIKQNGIHKSLIIVCGDCGLGFESEKHYVQTVFPDLIKVLDKYECYLVLIPGNHDDYSLFKSFVFNYPRLSAVPSYTILNVYFDKDKTSVKHSILCVGGAISIDRTYRIEVRNREIAKRIRLTHCKTEEAEEKVRKIYWENEAPVYDEGLMGLIDKEKCPIDIVCSHTAPSFCYPTTKAGLEYWLIRDEKLTEDLDDERMVFDRIYNYLKSHDFKLEKWCYGHFHSRNVEYIDGVKFRLLDRGYKLDTECIR